MKAIILGLVVALGGCAGLDSPDPASPYYAYSSGWMAQLKRPLEIEPDAATVRLQYGRIVPRNSVQEYDPFCVVELDTVRPEAQILQPGRFEILRVSRSISPLTVAASPLMRVVHRGDRAPTFLYYITHFRLRDAAQPNLYGMSCAWNQMGPGNRALMRHLTLDEMRGALGDWMRLIHPRAEP